jgi:adenosine deaminase
LVDRIAEQGIVLEVCPGSNVFLNAVKSWKDHPISPLMERGVKVTVSTDDPPFFGTTMTKEFDMLHRTFDWDDGVFRTLNKTALDAAFCDAATKKRIAELLEAA